MVRVAAREFAVTGEVRRVMMRMRTMVAGLVAALLLAMTMSGALAQPTTPVGTVVQADLAAAVTWLIEQQNDDGGFPGMEGESDPSMTIDATLALVAAGLSGQDTAGAVLAATEYLGSDAAAYATTGPGQAAKLVLATVAAGGNPHDIGGVDALEMVIDGQNPDTDIYGATIFEHALAMMALAATGSEVPASAAEALETSQAPDGGWAFDASTNEGAADSNTTAMVVQALVAIGEGDSELVSSAIDYLESTIEEDGALYQPGSGVSPDSSSTALVLQAGIASGQALESAPWAGLPPTLSGFQNESGAFHYNAEDTADNLFSTVQAIPAVAGMALPIVPVDSEATPVASPVTFLPERLSLLAA